jgi:hypothetical protein
MVLSWLFQSFWLQLKRTSAGTSLSLSNSPKVYAPLQVEPEDSMGIKGLTEKGLFNLTKK